MGMFCTSMMHPQFSMGTSTSISLEKEFSNKIGLEVKKCGLFVCVQRPFLTATPDGLVGSNAVVFPCINIIQLAIHVSCTVERNTFLS